MVNKDTQITLVPPCLDPIDEAIKQTLQRYADRLPLLDHIHFILPGPDQAPRLRSLLLKHAGALGHQAILGASISTIRSWINTMAGQETARVSSEDRIFLLIESLRQYGHLFNEPDPWKLADSLLDLFDEITLHQTRIPDDLEAFEELLRKSYGIDRKSPGYLSQEAKIVHTLWQAWHEQLKNEGYVDLQAAYLQKIKTSLKHLDASDRLVCIGLYNLLPAEAAWLGQLMQRQQADVYIHGETSDYPWHPDRITGDFLDLLDEPYGIIPTEPDPYSQFLSTVFRHTQDTLEKRAHDFRTQFPQSPASNRLGIFAADHPEQEAQAISVQIQYWLHNTDIRSIGIVTDDRKLARRLRALLERNAIELDDTVGWALSTSRAAALLENWLRIIEEDFAYLPLLDVLKSPFMKIGADADASMQAIYRFEQDIIQHENIHRGIERYRKHMQYRKNRLNWSDQYYGICTDVLTALETATQPLRSLYARKSAKGADYFHALQAGLQSLEIWAEYEHDPAGIKLNQAIEELLTILEKRPLELSWNEFRTILARHLERIYFKPAVTRSPVQLITLSQSSLCRFDGIILAGADQQHLPAPNTFSPYFNDSVRHELGLPAWARHYCSQFYLFRNILESADNILVTYCKKMEQQDQPASPWIEAMETFHAIAYQDNLAHPDLEQYILAYQAHQQSQIRITEISDYPAPAVPAGLLPGSLSAAGYQRIMDCPYRFFAADCLQLKPREEVREALEKSDYGERVHLCLQAFHRKVANLPGPYAMPLSAESRESAIEMMQEIAHAVFAKDLEDNFMHRGWLKRWLQIIPEYIDWEISRYPHWQVHEVEQTLKVPLSETLMLKGRLDRIDRNPAGAEAILDYKTGRTPSLADVQSGEAVQLPFYTLLNQNTSRVEYLELEANRIKSTAALEQDEIQDLSRQTASRLSTLMLQLQEGQALPAWGEDKVCEYCEFDGLCRKQIWEEVNKRGDHLA